MKILEPSEKVQDNNLKSPLELAYAETERRMREKLKALDERIANNENIGNEDLAFRIKEASRLKNMSKLQQKLNDYRENNRTNSIYVKDLEANLGRKNNAKKLAEHLTASGSFQQNTYFRPHHIICSKASSHSASRLLFLARKVEYGINDPDNGVWLPTKHRYAVGTATPDAVGHDYLHTNAYADYVYEKMLGGSGSKKSMKNQLNIIRLQLLNIKKSKNNLAAKILTKDGQEDLITYK